MSNIILFTIGGKSFVTTEANLKMGHTIAYTPCEYSGLMMKVEKGSISGKKIAEAFESGNFTKLSD